MHKLPTLDEYKLVEAFHNPFEEDEKSTKTPKHVADGGGVFNIRKETFNPGLIEWTKRDNGDYTVLARKSFYRDEIVEICPILFVPKEALSVKKIKDSIFEIDKEKELYGIVLGCGTLYRHSSKPNLSYSYNSKTKQIIFKTLRSVSIGEVLTIDYGKSWWEERMSINIVPKTNEIEDPNIESKMNSIPNDKNNPAISGVAIPGGGQS